MVIGKFTIKTPNFILYTLPFTKTDKKSFTRLLTKLTVSIAINTIFDVKFNYLSNSVL